MDTVGLKVLKDRLSEYVRRAESGETVLITNRERIVAELVPPNSERSPILADELLADAVRQGWIRPPALPARSLPKRAPVASWEEVVSELAEDREDR